MIDLMTDFSGDHVTEAGLFFKLIPTSGGSGFAVLDGLRRAAIDAGGRSTSSLDQKLLDCLHGDVLLLFG